ncbi:MAG TPA: universal stress protein, partial [Candidatus Sulfotelmatobacter sp.]|nr:universal stress protein [Candidatus Sulfotelmatobacter sp.]
GLPTRQPAIHNILATTDFSHEALAGVRYGVALARKLGTTLTLLHVAEPPSWMAGMEVTPLAWNEAKVNALARRLLKSLAEHESRRGLHLNCSLRTGKPFHEICQAARDEGADLLVIATHGYTGARHLLLGSTTERVVRHAPCPVLTVRTANPPRPLGKTPPLRLKKILVPLDFSSLSLDALPWAQFLATQFDAQLLLLHVVQTYPIDHLLGAELMNQTFTPLMKEAEAELQRLATDLSQSTRLKTSVVVREGTPFDAICRNAKMLGADLIVLTTHGYTGLKHIWLGSTAERVVRHAPCPVLVVRPPTRL